MDVTAFTWVIAIAGIALMGLLMTLQLIAVLRPRSQWTITNVYGADPNTTDPTAFYAVYQGYAWADTFLWGPVQLAGSVGMLLGHRWGFLLALLGSVPFVYTAVTIFIWDRDMGYRKNTLTYWLIVWGMFPAFGLLQATYCFTRLLD